MSYPIKDIEGVGPALAEKLAVASIKTTNDLLKHCADAKGRKAVSEKTGIGEGVLLRFANMADLMRISGIGGQYAELLEAAGVDTVKELKMRKADNLAAKMTEVNAAKKLTKGAVSAATVGKWIEQAKQLPPKITH